VNSQRFLIVAGEASGDMYGAEVARSLTRRFPGARMFGLGGQRMLDAGVEMEGDIRHTAVVGPFEAVTYFGVLYRIFRRLADRAEAEPPDAAILIDFPDFNLRLAKRLKHAGVPVVYYISPQVWAWREGRVKQIRELVDKMLVIFPFEEDIYKTAGVNVEFVGHPLKDTVKPTKSKEEFCDAYNLDLKKPIVALLPGSRRKEVRFILPTMCEAVDRIAVEKPETQFVLPLAPGLDRQLIDSMVQARPITVMKDETYNAIRYARAAMVASGTATLETALLGTPEVIVYRISGATWFLGKFLLKVRLFGIVNIILGEEVVPELFQDKFTAEAVSRMTIKLMDDVWMQSKIRGNYERLRRQLGGGRVADRVAQTAGGALRTSVYWALSSLRQRTRG
jgi:lipid-A-disaccharide synthase